MPVEALALVLCAATLHASWNVLLAGARDVPGTTAAALLVGCVVFLPAALAGWDVNRGAWPYIAASGALELVYFSLLAVAYSRAEMSLVYPLTRGLAPVLVLLASVVILGLATSAGEAVGVVLIAAGILAVCGVRGRADWGVLALVAGIACAIAAYTVVDRYGIRRASAVTYLELVLVPPALVYAAALGRERVRVAMSWRTAGAGVAMVGAYALVLVALRLASAASVAAVRETGIVIAVALAAIFLGEPVRPLRFAGAALVAAGVAVIAVS
jgi:drug/metabolite transporter (DMT)-like permease